MEVADVFVVNKADRPGAEKLRQEIEVTLGIRQGNAFRHVRAHHGRTVGAVKTVKTVGTVGTGAEGREGREAREVPVILTVAAKGDGIDELVAALEAQHAWLETSGTLAERRRTRLLQRTREVVERATRRWVWEETGAERYILERMDDIVAGRVSPYDVAAQLVDGLKQGERV
jgi:LAO/AO transport system kinase